MEILTFEKEMINEEEQWDKYKYSLIITREYGVCLLMFIDDRKSQDREIENDSSQSKNVDNLQIFISNLFSLN